MSERTFGKAIMSLAPLETRSSVVPAGARKSSTGRRPNGQAVHNRYESQMERLLEHAARIFCEKGYEGASMRDLSRACGMSLAGLYHYFSSKEELLYLIQKHSFRTIIEQARQRLAASDDPEERVRIFIESHLEYFLANKEAMKVLTHEDETLKNGRGTEIRAIKREYYRICFDLLQDLGRAQGLEFSGRLAVLSLFGMINWIYTWHNPRSDAGAKALAREMGDIFLHGVLHDQGDRSKVSRNRVVKNKVLKTKI
jgi:TetR/AcrR family transcriptional regulator, cholesterol catabolism regulator